jgi:hypothetical protein
MFSFLLCLCDTRLFVMVFYAFFARSEQNESKKPFLSASLISENNNKIDKPGPCRSTIEVVWLI